MDHLIWIVRFQKIQKTIVTTRENITECRSTFGGFQRLLSYLLQIPWFQCNRFQLCAGTTLIVLSLPCIALTQGLSCLFASPHQYQRYHRLEETPERCYCLSRAMLLTESFAWGEGACRQRHCHCSAKTTATRGWTCWRIRIFVAVECMARNVLYYCKAKKSWRFSKIFSLSW